jgi:uncharacterized protein (DUF1778 family)
MGKEMGRPKKPTTERKNVLISVRLKADEVEAIDAAAAKAGTTRSNWTRKTLTSAANVTE